MAVQHAWVESSSKKNVVGHADLRAWSAHADLGRIVMEIRAEFERSPPVLVSTTPVRSNVASPPPAYLGRGPLSPPAPHVRTSATPSPVLSAKTPSPVLSVKTPSIPAVFPELDELS